jgi:O-antigen/teichoic acid export membrane protein
MITRRASQMRPGNVAWTMIDQGLFALSSVALNVGLGRWLSATEYGAFAVAYALFLLIGALHTSLLTEPLLVFGSGKYASQQVSYLRTLLGGHWAMVSVASLLLLIAGGLMALSGVRPVDAAVAGIALALPFSLLMWFARRTAYVRFQPRLAATGSFIYLTIQSLGLFGLQFVGGLSLFAACLVVGLAGAVSGFWLVKRVAGETAEEQCQPARVLSDHWNYGRWATGTSLLMWVPLNFFFIVLSIFVNLEASAELKALSNLILPLLQTNAAIGALLLPALASSARNGQRVETLVRKSLITLSLSAIGFSLVVGILHRQLVHLLYAGKYDPQAGLLCLLLLIPILDALLTVLANALRALERPNQVFWSYLAGATSTMVAGLVLASCSGTAGAVTGILMGNFVCAVFLGNSLLGLLKRRVFPKHAGAVEVAG